MSSGSSPSSRQHRSASHASDRVAKVRSSKSKLVHSSSRERTRRATASSEATRVRRDSKADHQREMVSMRSGGDAHLACRLPRCPRGEWLPTFGFERRGGEPCRHSLRGSLPQAGTEGIGMQDVGTRSADGWNRSARLRHRSVRHHQRPFESMTPLDRRQPTHAEPVLQVLGGLQPPGSAEALSGVSQVGPVYLFGRDQVCPRAEASMNGLHCPDSTETTARSAYETCSSSKVSTRPPAERQACTSGREEVVTVGRTRLVGQERGLWGAARKAAAGVQ